MSIPAILSPVDHREHWSQGLIHALDAAVSFRRMGARCVFAHAVQLVHSVKYSSEQNLRLLSERKPTGHPHRGVYSFTGMSAVPSAVNSAGEMPYMSARRLKWSVRRKM